ncbi:hypothetical protein [Soonwooa sp.]|uniref:hypothetical protein n=1 Tax=Soonwooa sp. TaxID=1938592 RepID=UPI0035B3F5EE
MMKNFDIENLERKNSFATPPDFFAEMQNNVLNKTIPQKKEAKIIPLNFKWAAAAAIAAIGGLGIWSISNQNTDQHTTIAKNKDIVDSSYTIKNDEALAVYNVPQAKSTPQESPTTESKHPTTTEHNNRITNKPIERQDLAYTKVNSATPKASFAKASKSDAKITQVLAVMTPDQVSDLDKTVDQDVYLDLYN